MKIPRFTCICHCVGLLWAVIYTLSSGFVSATTLRVDLGYEPRSDLKSLGWENWFPSGDAPSQDFGDINISLQADDAIPIEFFSDKSKVLDGLTVGADGARVRSGHIGIHIKGLPAGRHSFVGYHHSTAGKVSTTYDVSVGGKAVSGVQPTHIAHHDDELGFSYVEFEVAAGELAVIKIASKSGGGPVLLNGFSLDAPSPARIALKPLPADLERHVDADDGTVELSWTPSNFAVRQHLYMVSDIDPTVSIQKLAKASNGSDGYLGSPQGNSFSAPITPKNSLLHYTWRVDSVDVDGKVTPGVPWTFRVRFLAFGGAEGYGRFALGGRGGRVIHVTNLDDSGPGSLRAAVEATGPRTVVFDVSGLIHLKSRLSFRTQNEFLTVAGQTAPGKGITLRGHTFGGIGGRDTIIRFVRNRMGDLDGGRDGMGLAASDHCIFDHCSISWTIDEAFSSRAARNITLQRTLISEALHGRSHGFAASISGGVGSFHHNLLANNSGRNCSLAGGTDQAGVHAGQLDIRNIVVFNWNDRTTDGGAREVNYVNNYYKPGPATRKMVYLNPQFEHPSFGPQQYYVAGNILEGLAGPEGPLPPFKGMSQQGEQDAPVTVPEPFFPSYVTTHSAEEAYENVLADVGCTVPMLDDHDKRILKEVRTGKVTYTGSVHKLPGIPDTQSDVGGWEDYPEIRRSANWDVDRDGIPGEWEKKNDLNPNDPDDGAMDPDGDGYTNLEDYLNWLAEGNS